MPVRSAAIHIRPGRRWCIGMVGGLGDRIAHRFKPFTRLLKFPQVLEMPDSCRGQPHASLPGWQHCSRSPSVFFRTPQLQLVRPDLWPAQDAA